MPQITQINSYVNIAFDFIDIFHFHNIEIDFIDIFHFHNDDDEIMAFVADNFVLLRFI